MKKLLPLLLPAAVLALASCSSEPSDWRPDKKVSLDMIPPGTRPSDNFDLTPAERPEPDKGGAIPRPINSGVRPDHVENPTPAAVMSADTQEGTAETKAERPATSQTDRGTKKPGDAAGAAGPAAAPGSAGSSMPSGNQPNN